MWCAKSGGKFYKITVGYLKYSNKADKDNYTTDIVAELMLLHL